MTNPAWAKLEPIRVRIMSEAYDCADRDEPEAYNSIKVMCGEVLALTEELIKAEREACAMEADYEAARWPYAPECREPCEEIAKAIRARGEK